MVVVRSRRVVAMTMGGGGLLNEHVVVMLVTVVRVVTIRVVAAVVFGDVQSDHQGSGARGDPESDQNQCQAAI